MAKNVPTNPKLWAKVQKLTKGEVKSINADGKKIVGPNEGKGFDIFPSAYCVPMDSEALTEKGWRKFEELKIGDRILAYDRVRDVLDWSPIQNLHFFPKAPTVRLKKQSLDVVCTPNHRWLHFRTSHLKSYPEDPRSLWSEIQAVQKGQKKVSHLIQGEKPNFQHWWDSYQHCTTYDEFLLESGRGGASLVPTNQMSLEGKLLVTAPYVGGQDSDWKFQKKYRGSWIEDLLKMSPDALESFYAACVMCDGWDLQNRSTNHGFSQKDPDHADAFELCAFLTGRRVRRRFDPERGLSFFTTNRKRYIPLPGTKVLPESDQPVWCPETEFGTWVMRQNGHVMVTGNSNGWASKTYKQLGGGWKKSKKSSLINEVSSQRVASRWVEGASEYHKINPWELTLEEFLNPYPKPKAGYVSLYHYTVPSHVKNIIRSGLKTPFAHQNPKFTAMNDKPLIHFQAPSDQVRRESGGGTVVPMQSDVAAKDILSVHLKTWPDPGSMLFGDLSPAYRSDAGKWYDKEFHQSYVEVALLTGQDVPQNVLRAYPKLKNRPHDPSSYEIWHNIYRDTVEDLIGSSDLKSRRAASLYFAASDPLSRIRSLIYDDPSVERDREILEIREDNPSFRRVIDDYLRGRFNPKYKATVYERVHSYDYPEDPTTDVLMEDEEYDSLDELLDDVQSYGWSGWSSSHPTSRDWIRSHPEENWRDGGTTEYTLFIRRSDKNHLSKDDIRYISKELRLR